MEHENMLGDARLCRYQCVSPKGQRFWVNGTHQKQRLRAGRANPNSRDML
jgi:hypothetical protein